MKDGFLLEEIEKKQKIIKLNSVKKLINLKYYKFLIKELNYL